MGLENIESLREKLVNVSAAMESVQQKVDEEKREMNDDESHQIENYLAAFEATEKEISRRERINAAKDKLVAPQPRMIQAGPAAAKPDTSADADAEPRRSPITGDLVAAKSGTHGFKSFGEFAMCVKNAGLGRGIDGRLRISGAATSVSQEATGSDGGFIVPPDMRTVIMKKVDGEDALLSRTDGQVTGSNSITVPIDETTPWQTSGGIQVTWEGEGTTIGQSKIALKSVTLRANKIAALIPVTDELLEDAPSLNAYLAKKVPEKLTYKINDALINGDGVGKPLGLLNSPALVTQAAEASQVAATVNLLNVTKMWSRMYAPCRRNAVWLCNQDIEPQLAQMVIPAASGVSSPAYLPSQQGVVGNPFNGSLFGRPIVYTEATAALGTVGDIMLVDFTQYLSLMKSSGLRADSSIHLFFDQGLVAFRFTMRIGGMPWWATSITRAKSALPLSCFIALAAR